MFRLCQLSDLESHWMNNSQRRFVDDWSIVAKYNYYKLYHGMYSIIKMQAILINERMFLYVRSEIHSNLMLCNKIIFLCVRSLIYKYAFYLRNLRSCKKATQGRFSSCDFQKHPQHPFSQHVSTSDEATARHDHVIPYVGEWKLFLLHLLCCTICTH